MRRLFTLFLSALTLQVIGQACLLPQSMNSLRPERCGIRHVKTLDNTIEVILEFEKRARVITPLDAGNAKGKPVTLRGIYTLTYAMDGTLLAEKRSYLQTNDIPGKSMFFGVNEQRGELLESDPVMISEADYQRIPWIANRRRAVAKTLDVSPSHYFETSLNVDKENKIVDLQIVKYLKQSDGAQSDFQKEEDHVSLETYDSCTKKKYWTSLYVPTTDQTDGYTLAMLNQFDRQKSKEISTEKMRLVSFDSTGTDTNFYALNFKSPMEIVYREEEFNHHPSGTEELALQTWVFTKMSTKGTQQKYNQFEYYSFDKKAKLVTSASILAKENLFELINNYRNDTGIIYMSNQGYLINSLFVDRDGKYNVSSTGDLSELKKLMTARSNHLGVNTVKLVLDGDPKVFEDKSMLMVYRVEENVGVRGAASTNAATMICHGLAVVHLSQEGRIMAAKYYQRPENADPRATVEVGPIERNEKGLISFYAKEKTSLGTYPVLYTIKGGNIRISRNDVESTASKFIYYDSDEAIVGYFGLITDPDDPRISVRTVEILKYDD